MEVNPYKSPETHGKPPNSGGHGAALYFVFASILAIAILLLSQRVEDYGNGPRVRWRDPMTIGGTLTSAACFASGIYVLVRSRRRPNAPGKAG